MSEGRAVAAGASCARCRSGQPTAARYCHRCGHDHLEADGPAARPMERVAHFVARPAERVRSFNVVSALLPLSSSRGLRAYQVAFAVALGIPLIAAAAGAVPFALVAAAVAVPVVLTVYLYDVNEWEDQPIPVVLAAIVTSGVAGAMLIRVVDATLLDAGQRVGLGRLVVDDPTVDVDRLIAMGVVAPLVALLAALVGPLWLASRPRFDDLIDGLTFGAVSGAAYAAGETLMLHRGILGADSAPGDAVLWMSIVANAAVVKPVVYGAAIAIAAAAYSGVGPGHEGFTRRFAKGVAIAAVGMVAYASGVALLANLDGATGAALGLAWAAIVAGALVVVLRTQLHLGVLEAALESARGKPSRHEVVAGAHCGECEMALAPLALFCNACGTSVRATSKDRQRANVGVTRTAAGVPS